MCPKPRFRGYTVLSETLPGVFIDFARRMAAVGVDENGTRVSVATIAGGRCRRTAEGP